MDSKGETDSKKSHQHLHSLQEFGRKAFSAPPSTDLPSFVVKEATPFSTVGVDFAGPFLVRKEGKQMEKVYIVFYTCSVTRAVHLDLFEDKSAPVFLRSFRKFVARRRMPALVAVDHAKAFRTSKNFFMKLHSDPQIRNYFDSSCIRWRFNLDRSRSRVFFFERLVQVPNFGGCQGRRTGVGVTTISK